MTDFKRSTKPSIEAWDRSGELWFGIMVRHGIAVEKSPGVVTIISNDPVKIAAAFEEFYERDPEGCATFMRILENGATLPTMH